MLDFRNYFFKITIQVPPVPVCGARSDRNKNPASLAFLYICTIFFCQNNFFSKENEKKSAVQ